MTDRVFVDTNVLLYAHDVDAGRKRAVAAALLRELWNTHRGVLSTQVLQEFYVNVTRKIRKPLAPAMAREIIRSYAAWPLRLMDMDDVLRASEIEEIHRLSFWDALIVVAAHRLGATTLVSEDLNAGQRIEGVLVKNPFA